MDLASARKTGFQEISLGPLEHIRSPTIALGELLVTPNLQTSQYGAYSALIHLLCIGMWYSGCTWRDILVSNPFSKARLVEEIILIDVTSG